MSGYQASANERGSNNLGNIDDDNINYWQRHSSLEGDVVMPVEGTKGVEEFLISKDKLEDILDYALLIKQQLRAEAFNDVYHDLMRDIRWTVNDLVNELRKIQSSGNQQSDKTNVGSAEPEIGDAAVWHLSGGEND